jgi:hypothetical protein
MIGPSGDLQAGDGLAPGLRPRAVDERMPGGDELVRRRLHRRGLGDVELEARLRHPAGPSASRATRSRISFS